VETVKGMEALEEILAVDGVDGVFIGPSDLAADMGHLGQTEHPEVRAAIEAGLGKIAASDKAAGILALADEAAELYRGWGAQFLAVAIDVVMFVQAANAKMAAWRGKS